MSYEEQKLTDRLDLGGHHSRKKQHESNNFVDWRTSSRIADTDEIFKAVVKAEKLRRNQTQQVKQGGITTTRLTEEQINQRIQRMNIIQQAVKAGTYNDPSKPWNKQSRWIEDGDPIHSTNYQGGYL